MKDDLAVMGIIFLTLVVPFSIGYILISYTKSLEDKKCACSANIRRKYIKYYGYFLFLASLVGLTTFILYIKNPDFRKFKSVLKIFILVIQFLAAYVIFTYSKILEDRKCNCSDSWKKVFLKYYGYALIVFLALLFFCLLMSFLILISTGDNRLMLDLRKILLGCSMS